MKKVILIATALSLTLLASSCEFFETPQERRGINPKPINGQADWELEAYRRTVN